MALLSVEEALRRILDGEKDLQALLPENYRPRPITHCSDLSAVQQAA